MSDQMVMMQYAVIAHNKPHPPVTCDVFAGPKGKAKAERLRWILASLGNPAYTYEIVELKLPE